MLNSRKNEFNSSNEGISSSSYHTETTEDFLVEIQDRSDSSNTINNALAKYKLKYRIACLLNAALSLGCAAGFGYFFYILIDKVIKHYHLNDLIQEDIVGLDISCEDYANNINNGFNDKTSAGCHDLLAALEVKDTDPDSYVHYCHELFKEYCDDPSLSEVSIEGTVAFFALTLVASVLFFSTRHFLRQIKQSNDINSILDVETKDNVLAIIEKYNLIDPKDLPTGEVNNHLQVNLALEKLAINKDLIRELVQAKTYSTLFRRLQEAAPGDNDKPNPFSALPTEIIYEIASLTMTSTATSTCRLFASSSVKSSRKGKEKVDDEAELESFSQNEQEVTSMRMLKFKEGIFNRLIQRPEEILIDTKNGQIYFNK